MVEKLSIIRGERGIGRGRGREGEVWLLENRRNLWVSEGISSRSCEGVGFRERG